MRILAPALLLLFVIECEAKNFASLFEKVDPAVVQIFATETELELTVESTVTTTSEGIGSGVIIGKDGHILTAAHVVHSAEKIVVELVDGQKYDARVISSVQHADLALIQLLSPPDDLIFIEPSDSDAVDIGEEVFVIGAPYGLRHTLTVGHLSGRRVSTDQLFGFDLEFLQTDAAINEGNSGGPLFSSTGRLVGIVSYISTKSGGNVGLGFAASTNMAERLLLNRPPIWSGVRFLPLNSEALKLINIDGYSTGFLVQHVAQGSLGEKFKLRAGFVPITFEDQELLLGGDVIVEVDGKPIVTDAEGWADVRRYMNSIESGGRLEITVVREGTSKQLVTEKP